MPRSFGETWEKFANGQADYRELILAGHEKSFRLDADYEDDDVRGLWLFEASGSFGADALRIIADELDKRNKCGEFKLKPEGTE